MTSSRTRIRIALAVLFLLCVIACQAFADGSSAAHDLMQAAHDAVNFDKFGPYELRSNVIIHGEKPKTIAGHLRVLSNGDLGKTEFQVGPYEGIRITQVGKQYLVRSRDYMPNEVRFLSTFLLPWDPVPPKPRKESFQFSRSYKQKIHDADAVCVSEKTSFGERFMCFDSSQHVLLRRDFSQDGQIEYADYVSFENGPLFPKTIIISRSGKPVLEIKDIVVEKKNAGEADFAPSADAIELEKCDHETPPRVLKSPDPSFEGVEQSEKVSLFVIVGKDGAILTKHEDSQGKGKLKGDQVLELTQTAVRKWRFSPAMCDSHPIAAEVGIEMHYVRF